MSQPVTQETSASQLTPLVIYHGPGCWDGFCAAWIARKHLRKLGEDNTPDEKSVEYLPAQYGDTKDFTALLEKVKNRRVFILDFSYPKAVLLELAKSALSVLVLDHHQTAEQELKDCKADNLAIHFDRSKSGARLTHDYFFPDTAVSWLCRYTEDRDLWLHRQMDTHAVNAALRSHPLSFKVWDDLASISHSQVKWCNFIHEGEAILREQAQYIAAKVKQANDITLLGYQVPCVNTTYLTSEVAGKLAEGRPFAVAYFLTADRWVFSLRSAADGVDVSIVAKAFGGGGHKHASGFTVHLDGITALMESLWTAWPPSIP